MGRRASAPQCAGKSQLLTRCIVAVGTALAAGFACSPASASPDAPPGSIIVIRDVPARRAYVEGLPGDVSAVQTAPAQQIFDLSNGAAVPLGDEESANISSGPVADSTSTISRSLDNVTSVLSGNEHSQLAQGAAGGAGFGGGGAGGQISGAIQSGMSAMGAALGAIKGSVGP